MMSCIFEALSSSLISSSLCAISTADTPPVKNEKKPPDFFWGDRGGSRLCGDAGVDEFDETPIFEFIYL